MTGLQVRAARHLLGWSSYRLGALAGVPINALRAFEVTGSMQPPMHGKADRLLEIRKILEAAGVEFIPENGGAAGVRLRTVGA